MEGTETVSKLHDESSVGNPYSAADGGTHLCLGNTNVCVTHFIDVSDIFCNLFAGFVFLKYKFSNVKFVIC